jgi:hypothetical protein
VPARKETGEILKGGGFYSVVRHGARRSGQITFAPSESGRFHGTQAPVGPPAARKQVGLAYHTMHGKFGIGLALLYLLTF